MAIVIHYPHGKDKKGYAYWHHRVGDRVICEYMGDFELSTSRIMDNGFRERPGYEKRHAEASKIEKEEYGKENFNKLNEVIDKKLGPGELAGKYSGEKVIVNEKIPDKYHEQIIGHELVERLHDPEYKEGFKPANEHKIKTVMHEFEKGELKSSSGNIVTSRKQALAIAYSEARKKE